MVLGSIISSIDFRIREVQYPALLCLEIMPGMPVQLCQILKGI